jgi:hypothetical protein
MDWANMAPPDRAASAKTDIGVNKGLLIETTPERCGGSPLLMILLLFMRRNLFALQYWKAI